MPRVWRAGIVLASELVNNVNDAGYAASKTAGQSGRWQAWMVISLPFNGAESEFGFECSEKGTEADACNNRGGNGAPVRLLLALSVSVGFR